jgi:uncharacterized RDD family membrane protein YckC
MLACIIDLVLMTIIISPALVFIFKVMGNDLSSHSSLDLSAEKNQQIVTEQMLTYLKINVLQLVIASIVTFFFWRAKNGTPGKTILKMHIVDAKTLKPMTFWQSFGRMFSYIFSLLPLAVGFVWIEYDKKKQGFHDKISGTVVIKLPKHTKLELEELQKNKEQQQIKQDKHELDLAQENNPRQVESSKKIKRL